MGDPDPEGRKSTVGYSRMYVYVYIYIYTVGYIYIWMWISQFLDIFRLDLLNLDQLKRY